MHSVLVKILPTGVSLSFLADMFSVVLSVGYLVMDFRQFKAGTFSGSGLLRY